MSRRLIYCYHNIVTGLKYIGQTKNEKARKYTQMKQAFDYDNPSKFCCALREYGRDNFVYGIVEEVDGDIYLVDERELYWIDKYDTINNGYNTRYLGRTKTDEDGHSVPKDDEGGRSVSKTDEGGQRGA